MAFDILQFGYDLFRQPPATFAPLQNVPVGPDYVIGPGDEIRIAIWGSLDAQLSVTVDRDGTITLPKVGTLGVTGLTFQQLKTSLQKEISKHYTDFQMNVSMGQLRSITVYVVGNAKKPGAYSLAAMSTLLNALFESGGPDKSGSMRDVQLKRAGKTIIHFDLYGMLLKGDKTHDVRLMPGDVIFIPKIGPLVGIAGSVKQPAIYELAKTTRLTELITMAGGLKGLAFKGRFQVQRVMDHQYINVVEGDLLDMQQTSDKNLTLQDGDLVKIYAVAEVKNTVNLTGAVLMPGEYGVAPGVTTVKEVLERAGGLQVYAASTAELTRLTITPDGPQTNVTSFDIRHALEGDPANNFSMQRYDYVKVHAVPDWQLYRKADVEGEVRFPGVFALRKGEKLSSFLERAGGYTDKAYLPGIIFTRQSVRDLQQRQLKEMIDRLEGELLAAGSAGVSTAATADEAKILAEESRQKQLFLNNLRQVQASGRMVVKFDRIDRLKNGPYDIEIEEGDTIVVPRNPQSIQVIGAVFSQGSFVYQKDKGYKHYINLCGGFTDSADDDNTYILKTNGAAVKPSSGVFWDKESSKWTYGNGRQLEPGDTIVVPPDLSKFAWLRNAKDIMQILFQVMTSAGIVFAVL